MSVVLCGVLHRRREPDAPETRRHRLQLGEAEHELVAAFRFRERMDLVHDYTAEPREDACRVLVGEEEREALGRRQQDIWRVGPLPPLLRVGGVARPVLDPDRQAHLIDGCPQVAPDVGRQRLQRRDVDRMKTLASSVRELCQSRQKPRQRLAAARRRDEQERRLSRPRHHLRLMRMDLPALGGKPVVEGAGERGHVPDLPREKARENPGSLSVQKYPGEVWRGKAPPVGRRRKAAKPRVSARSSLP